MSGTVLFGRYQLSSMAEVEFFQEMESTDGGQVIPEISQTSDLGEEYDPMDPTDEKGSASITTDIAPSKMKVADLRSELSLRGLDTKGTKAILVQRLESALESSAATETSNGNGTDETILDADRAAVVVVEASDDDVLLIEDEEAESDGTENVDAPEDDDIEDAEVPTPAEIPPSSGQEEVPTVTTDAEVVDLQPDEPMEEETAVPAAVATDPEKITMDEPEPATDAVAKEEVEKARVDVLPAEEEMETTAEDNATEGLKINVVETTTRNEGKPETKEDVSKKDLKPAKPTEKFPPPELEKYWKAVKDKPTDFTGWTYLLQYVEQHGHMPSVRKAFNAFLSRYPYCYGYWKKFADMERKKGSPDKAHEVFEAGVRAIPLSVDLWMQYIQFIGQTSAKDEITDKLRRLFEKAIAAAGTDFRSDKLWDMYINFEKERKEWLKITEIYDQLITIPTQLYSHHFDKFKDHVNSHHPKDILSVDEFIQLRMEVVDDLGVTESGLEDSDDVVDDTVPPGDEDAPPGVDEGPPGMELTASPSAKKTPSSKEVEAENEGIRKKVIASRCGVYRQTEQEVSKRWSYEEGIRRPYFHAKPLEKSQLKNWREYIQFEMTSGTHERVLILYERCLVACALYEEFWLRYAKYLLPHSTEGVSSVYKRACNIHLPKKPSIHLHWAAFEEKQGNITAAREILQKLEENIPDLVMVTMERVNFERRQGNAEEVVSILRDRMAVHKDYHIRAFLGSKLCRFYAKVVGDVHNARKVLYEILDESKDKLSIYLQLLDLEMQQMPTNEQIILDLLQKSLQASTKPEEKFRFSQRRLAYIMDFGRDIAKLQSAYDEHQEIMKTQLDTMQTASKKRSGDTSNDTAAAQPDKKQKKSDTKGAGAAVVAHQPPAIAQTPATTYQQQTPDYSQQQQSQQQPLPSQQQPQHNNQSWGNYNQQSYGQQGGSYGPPPQSGPGTYNPQQPPPANTFNQPYQQYQQGWGGYNQGYYPR